MFVCMACMDECVCVCLGKFIRWVCMGGCVRVYGCSCVSRGV